MAYFQYIVILTLPRLTDILPEHKIPYIRDRQSDDLLSVSGRLTSQILSLSGSRKTSGRAVAYILSIFLYACGSRRDGVPVHAKGGRASVSLLPARSDRVLQIMTFMSLCVSVDGVEGWQQLCRNRVTV